MLRSSLFLAASLFASVALAQPSVQSDFYEGALRNRGSSIIFCVWPNSPMAEFDRAVGREVAALQFLEAEFYDVRLMSSGTQEAFEQELFIHLMDNCDAVMSTSLTWQPLPEWLTVTEPYHATTYMLASTQEGIDSANALPPDVKVGSLMLSQADMTFAQWLRAGNRSDLRRIPYDTARNIFTAISTGQLDAGIIPDHALPLLRDEFADAGILVEPLTAPNLEAEPLGMALLSRDAYLRERLDEAISTLRDDGTLDSLAQQSGLTHEN